MGRAQADRYCVSLQDLVPPYLDALIQKLLSLLQNGQKVVQEGALTAMASVADCAKDSFAKYYTEVSRSPIIVSSMPVGQPHINAQARPELQCPVHAAWTLCEVVELNRR